MSINIVEVRKMLSHKSQKKRIEAARGLAKIGDTSGLNILLECLDDSKTRYRVGALSALCEIADKIEDEKIVIKIASMLKDKNKQILTEVLFLLGELKHPASIPALIDGLFNKDIYMGCVSILGEIGKPAVPALVKVLSESTDDHARWCAAMVLNGLKDVSSVPALIKALNDKSPLVQGIVATLLGKLKAKKAIPALMKAAERGAGMTGIEPIDALGEMGDKTVLPFLLKMLKNENPNIKAAVAEALGKIGDASIISHLEALINDNNYRVRKEVKKSIQLLKVNSKRK